ncbi:hypothetical protein HY624_03985 [Candidatus Uhrbacteria bacterium]|nr:hypothetical protein [Candidatus Uhrbacteria bacterium]
MQQWFQKISPLLILALLVLIGVGLGVIAWKTQQEKTQALMKLAPMVSDSKKWPATKEASKKAAPNRVFRTLEQLVSEFLMTASNTRPSSSTSNNQKNDAGTLPETYPTAQPSVPGLTPGYQLPN